MKTLILPKPSWRCRCGVSAVNSIVTTGKEFFDTTDLQPGESLDEQLDTEVSRRVLVSVRRDDYSSRVWCGGNFRTDELFLDNRMVSYLGTYWEVDDTVATPFAPKVYAKLAISNTLQQSTPTGREALFDNSHPDWANYVLYGGGNLWMVEG